MQVFIGYLSRFMENYALNECNSALFVVEFQSETETVNRLTSRRMNTAMRIFILGDSTSMTYAAADAPKAGWGQFLGEYFLRDAAIINHAIGGRSTKSFISEGRLLRVEEELQPGDYALIQFGHNDSTISLVWRRTFPWTSFVNNLLLMACAVRRRGAFPVLMTPVCQRVFNTEGKIEDTFAEYVQAVSKLAQTENIPLLDMRIKTMELLKELGAEKSRELYMHLPPGEWPAWPGGLSDNTHTRVEGAKAFAGLLASCIRESGLELKNWLKEEIHD